MAGKLGTKKSAFKIQRALFVELPGLGKPGALERRAYPPGQHGHSRRKLSEYSIRLREKQKLKFHYVLREEQLRRLAQRAKANGGDWVNEMIIQLESRLDNVTFRMGWARSILAARQLVSHGHVKVNGKKATIGSMVLKMGDKLELSEKARKSANVMASMDAPRLELPAFLDRDHKASPHLGEIKERPNPRDIPFDFSTQIVTEYFSKL